MNIRGFSYSLLKLFSIWFFIITVIPSLISFLLLLFVPDQTRSFDSYMGFFWGMQIILYSVVSIVLWFTAPRLSSAIGKKYPEGETEEINLSFEQNSLIQTGLILIALFIFVNDIPDLLANLFLVLQQITSDKAAANSNYYGGIIKPAVSIIVAVYFIFGRKKITDIISQLRIIGVEKK